VDEQGFALRGFVIASLALALFAAPTGQAHNVPGIHNRVHAVHWAFCGKQTKSPCGLGYQAVRVAKCESGWSLTPRAHNGIYLGMFQVSSHWRTAVPGWGMNPWAQALHAYRVWRLVGWSHWACS
jgi:hypothetical protein